jgi:hypothetical protein
VPNLISSLSLSGNVDVSKDLFIILENKSNGHNVWLKRVN